MQPKCTECGYCYIGRSKKHKGVTAYCKLMDDADVGASHFGRNSPRVCPKRNITGGRTLKVNICGIEHEIVELEDSFGVDIHMGEIEYKNCIIKINKEMPDQLKRATLCHEILHGMLVHIGREDLSNDEQLVTALGNAINNSFIIRLK